MRKNLYVKRHNILSWIFGIPIVVSSAVFFAALWYKRSFGNVGFNSIIFTFISGFAGCDDGIFWNYFIGGLAPALLASTAAIYILWIPRGRRKHGFFFRDVIAVVVSLAMIVLELGLTANMSGFFHYLRSINTVGTIFEEEYVDPNDTTITFPETKQNLIVISMESMESSFASKEAGGALDHNCLPGMTALAEENVHFSDSDALGGFSSVYGTTWTSGAMAAASGGIPLKLCGPSEIALGIPLSQSFSLDGLTTLSDILHDAGYTQSVMFGSDSDFGFQKQFYLKHGVDAVYDYHTAISEGVIPEDYKVWWGMEDAKVYDYAKDKITEMAAGEAPFAFTMYTLDTHQIGGYVCENCDHTYDAQYENVYACADAQVTAFIEWIQEQDFYENTTILIMGDHCSMDNEYVTTHFAKDYSRHVYNCYIHAATEPVQKQNRTFTTLDLFPTTLSAMGCTIDGDRLGLGVNLFSEKQTLAEEMGLEAFDEAVSYDSAYYAAHFRQ